MSADAQQDFSAANSSSLTTKGTFVVQWQELEGGNRETEVQKSSQVSFPILSTGLETDDDKTVIYHKKGGTNIDHRTGAVSHFVGAHGVYWQLMVVDQSILNPESPPEGFGRQG